MIVRMGRCDDLTDVRQRTRAGGSREDATDLPQRHRCGGRLTPQLFPTPVQWY